MIFFTRQSFKRATDNMGTDQQSICFLVVVLADGITKLIKYFFSIHIT